MFAFAGRHVSHRHFARHNKLGLLNQNDLAALVYRPAEKTIVPRSGRERDDVTSTTSLSTWSTSPGRVGAGQLNSPPAPTKPACEWRTTFDIQTHRDRGGVPTARRQTLEDRALSGMLVRVKGLRIKLKRECIDLRFVKPVRPAGKALSEMKVVKIQLVPRGSGCSLACSLEP
jgi:hypothetical protein